MAKRHDTEKFASLDQLSTEALEELLRADIDSPGNDNDEAVFHILEVLEERDQTHPTGDAFDVEKAWADFQQYYNIPEGEGLSLYPAEDEAPIWQAAPSKIVRLHTLLRVVGVAAAAVTLILGTMIGVQASGVDVFGAIGRWTDETFHFVSFRGAAEQDGVATPSPENSRYYNALQAALEECGITADLAPTWYPEGADASEPQVLHDALSETVSFNFTLGDERFFSVDITQYHSAAALDALAFEKDSTSVEPYVSGPRAFYIMSNTDTISATYSDGLLVESILGNLTMEELMSIIDSIGGV